MKTNKDYKPDENVLMAFVGSPGARKTTLALQFPKPYVFDADQNMSGPVRHLGDVTFAYDSAYVDDEGKEVPKAMRYAHFVKCVEAAAKSDEVGTIILDSLTSMLDIFTAEVKRQAGQPIDSQMTMPNWGAFAHLVRHVFLELKGLKKPVIVTMHDKLDKDDVTGSYYTFLHIPGQSKDNLTGLFSDCLSFYTKTVSVGGKATTEYRIRTMPSNQNDKRGVKCSLGLPEDFANSYDNFKPFFS